LLGSARHHGKRPDRGAVQKSYFQQGFEPKASSPAELGKYLETETETYRRILAENGIKDQ
jgi:tripartite-type tricarboxylate transporter receptor subunit TctC